MTRNEFLERAREKHGYKYEYPNLPDNVTSNQIIDVEYDGVIYKQKVVKHILLGRCPEKNTKKRTQQEYLDACVKMWGDKYDYSLVEYKGSNKKVKIIYDDIVFEQNAQSHINGLAPEEHMNRDFFIKKSIDKWGDKYDYSQVEYKDCKTKVKILYKGEVYEQTPYNHLISAPEKVYRKKTKEQFIAESQILYDNKYSYDKVNYLSNQMKVMITCPIHGDFEQKPLIHLQGRGCSLCNDSAGETEIVKFLNKYKINFERHKKFKGCKNGLELSFDFYIPSIRTCIEFQGKQHFEPLEDFGGAETYQMLKVNNKIKEEYCEDNYINLIRIKYDQFNDIYRILWDNLKNNL